MNKIKNGNENGNGNGTMNPDQPTPQNSAFRGGKQGGTRPTYLGIDNRLLTEIKMKMGDGKCKWDG